MSLKHNSIQKHDIKLNARLAFCKTEQLMYQQPKVVNKLCIQINNMSPAYRSPLTTARITSNLERRSPYIDVEIIIFHKHIQKIEMCLKENLVRTIVEIAFYTA